MATTSKAIEAVLSAACVADALGAATECMHPDEIVRVFGGPVTTFRTPPEKTPFAKGLAHATIDQEYIHKQRLAMYHSDDQRRGELRQSHSKHTHIDSDIIGKGRGKC